MRALFMLTLVNFCFETRCNTVAGEQFHWKPVEQRWLKYSVACLQLTSPLVTNVFWHPSLSYTWHAWVVLPQEKSIGQFTIVRQNTLQSSGRLLVIQEMLIEGCLETRNGFFNTFFLVTNVAILCQYNGPIYGHLKPVEQRRVPVCFWLPTIRPLYQM